MPSKTAQELVATHAEWLILLLLFPVIVTISPARSFLLVFLFTPFVIRYVQNKDILPATPFNIALFGLLIMILVSLWVTYDISFSLRKVANLTWGIFLFWALQNFLRINKKNKFWLTGLICGFGLLVSLISLFNPSISLKIPGGNMLFSAISLIPASSRLQELNPNEIGGILAWCIPLSYSFSLSTFQKKTREKTSTTVLSWPLSMTLIVPLVPMLVILLYTSSRTAIGSVFFSLSFITWLLWTNQRKGMQLLWLMALILIILFYIFLADVSSTLTFFFEPIESLTKMGNTSAVGSLNDRAEIWSRALYGIRDFPFTGMGMNTFRRIVRILYPLFLIPPSIDIAHAHNQFLQAALDLGILGLIFFVSLWINAVFLVICSWRHSIKGSMHQMLVAGLAGSLLASFIFGLTDAIALGAIPGFVFWLLLSIISNVDSGESI